MAHHRPKSLDVKFAGCGLLRRLRRHRPGYSRRHLGISRADRCTRFEIQRIIKLFGHIGGDEAELTLDDVRVEPWQLVGDLHKGFAEALYGVSLTHVQLGPRS